MDDAATHTEVGAKAAYTLREDKRVVRYWWVIERADGSVCFRLARKERQLAEDLLHNLLHGHAWEDDSHRDAA